jgi:2-polyprenyl-3-methyl-5-hydroxy-6-metoxy-1,4-benzoquinol methylase
MTKNKLRITNYELRTTHDVRRTTNLHYNNCNICGNYKTSLIAVQNDYRFVRCESCGLVYMNPRPDADELKTIYDTYHQRNGKVKGDWEVMMRDNFWEVSEMLAKKFPSGGRLLDIGCGYGHFLRIMEGLHWRAEGIDPSTHTVNQAGKAGRIVTQTTIDDAVIPECSFNAVTMFYVLEHVTDPMKTLRKVFSLLVPGGSIVIRIPHTTPLVRLLSVFNINNNLYDAPFHLYDFSPSAVTRILEQSGFANINIIPGEPTRPHLVSERIVSVLSGYAAKLLYRISNDTLLLPGVSKTIIASRP